MAQQMLVEKALELASGSSLVPENQDSGVDDHHQEGKL